MVNDGSTDGTGALCARYAGADGRVKVLSQPNGGVSAARNNGLRHCTGEWVMFVDGDDWLEPDAVARALGQTRSRTADLVAFSYYKNERDWDRVGQADAVYDFDCTRMRPAMAGHCILYPPEWPTLFPGELVTGMNLCNPFAKLYRRSVIAENGLRFNEAMVLAEDQDFNLQFIARAGRVAYLNAPLYHYRLRAGSASRDCAGVLEKHSRANEQLRGRIDALKLGADIEPFWQGHLVQSVFIITRLFTGAKQPFGAFLKDTAALRGYVNAPDVRAAIASFPIDRAPDRNKKLVILAYRRHLVYTINLLYRFLK